MDFIQILPMPGGEREVEEPEPVSVSLERLLDPQLLDIEEALALARGLAESEPLLDMLLVRQMFAHCEGDLRRLETATTLRVLALVEAVSDGSRIPSALAPLLRHPSEHVRSKLALLLGRHSTNLTRVKSFLACEDGRIRANAVESLWGRLDPEARALLWQYAADWNNRVMANALLGLYWAGEKEACPRLIEMASSEEPLRRAAGAWAMGQTGDTIFAECLTRLLDDDAEAVRRMAVKSRKRLQDSNF